MTKVIVSKKEGHIVSVDCKGHSGYAPEGEDIVCAALSAVVQTAVLGVLRVAGAKADYRTDEDKGSLKLTIKEADEEKRRECDIILETMLLGVKDLQKGFSAFIKLEVKDDVY